MARKSYNLLLSQSEREELRDLSVLLSVPPSEVIRLSVAYVAGRIVDGRLPDEDVMRFLGARALRRMGTQKKGGA